MCPVSHALYSIGVLLLDEPTSGLDSYTAEHVCKTLNDLAMRRSRSILLTIHQPGPEITRLFDHVLILSNGHTIFNGPADLLVRYFNSLGYALPEFTNPCDYYGQSLACFPAVLGIGNTFEIFASMLWHWRWCKSPVIVMSMYCSASSSVHIHVIVRTILTLHCVLLEITKAPS